MNMHANMPDEDTLEQQLAAEKQALQNLERDFNREVMCRNPRIFGPTRADWDFDQELRWRQQEIKCKKLEKELSELRQEKSAAGNRKECAS